MTPRQTNTLGRTLRAGVITGIVDGTFSSVLSAVFYGSTVTRLFQGVAATLLGPSALNGGARTAAIGILMHFGVALAWSAVFQLVVMRLSPVRNLLRSPYGIVKVAAIYGPFIWLVMSLIVVPSLTHRPTPITVRWWIQFFGHFPFVGLPIVFSSTRRTLVA